MDTQLTWYGQSAFKIVTPSGKILLIDPWLSNPVFENAKQEIAALKNVDFILITHGHSDHVGDAVGIGKKTGAKLVATFDLADAMVKHLGYPTDQAQSDTVGHFGGELTLLNGEVKVAFARAHHGSGVAADDRSALRHGGAPGGFVITIRGGPTIYHTGDTDLFSDMALLYRSNAQSRVLEHSLFRAKIAYKVYGGLRFFERQEVKHAMGVCLHASLARVPAFARDDAGESLHLEPVLHVDGHGIAKRTHARPPRVAN